MLDEDKIARLRGAKLVAAGDEVGEIEEIFAHRAENRPALAIVRADDRRVLVPLPQPQVTEGQVSVDWPADQVRQAPEAAGGDALTEDETDATFAHFGLTDADLTADDAHPGAIPGDQGGRYGGGPGPGDARGVGSH